MFAGSGNQRPKTWLIVVSALLSSFLLLGSLGLALFGADGYNASYISSCAYGAIPDVETQPFSGYVPRLHASGIVKGTCLSVWTHS